MSNIQRFLSVGGFGMQLPALDDDPTDADADLGPVIYNKKGEGLKVKAFGSDPAQLFGALVAEYDGSKSFQGLSYDLTLGAEAGKDDPNTAYLASIMGNTHGADLLKTGCYLAGVIGSDSITGTKATKYPKGGLLGQISDLVTDADGAVIAQIDGDSGVTKANAAFKAMMRNSTAGSGFDYGLDLYDPAFGSYKALAILKALERSPHQVCRLEGDGVPVDGTTGLNFADKGSEYTDYTNGEKYINTGTKAATVWKKYTHA